MNPERKTEEDIVQSYLRGEVTAEEMHALDQRLLKDPEARAAFRKAARLDANLRFNASLETAEFRGWQEPSEERIAMRQPQAKRHASNWHLVAATMAIAATVMLALRIHHSFHSPQSDSPGYVATLLSAGSLHGTSGAALHAGTRLWPGNYRLIGGTATVRFDSGALLVFDEAAKFQIGSHGSLTLETGKVIFQSDGTSGPFKLRTPRSLFQDIGTEYAVVTRERDEELHVLSGKVRRTSPAHPSLEQEINTAGTARRYSSAGLPGSAIRFDASLADLPRLQVGSTAVAPLLAYEPFRYKGAIAVGADRDGGTGWQGPWLEARAMPDVGLDEQSLPWPGIAAESGAVQTTGRTAMHRMLNRPLRLDRDAVYYFSYLFRRSASPIDHLNMLMFVLRQRGKTEEQEIADGSALKVSLVSANAVFSIHLVDSTARASIPLVADTTYLLIGKIVASNTMPDQVFVKVYSPQDVIPSSEPADWLLATEPIKTNLVLDQLSLEFDTKAKIGFDEFKLGTTWENVSR
ncbi:MAG: hypothetical protein V4710_04285 [Verrucomicrobiota bacterium]